LRFLFYLAASFSRDRASDQGRWWPCRFLRTDVRDGHQVRNLIAFAEQTYGGVTVLVNNASRPFRHGDETDSATVALLSLVFDAITRRGNQRGTEWQYVS
jgi:NAD(P)-dependent dehydrogenase (short-subunit alcohol dehydrogenase family)